MAKEINEIDKCFVSTDCEEIANISQSNGAIIIKRPTELSQDNSPEWKAWEHAINWTYERYGSFTKFLSLPATAPLRSNADPVVYEFSSEAIQETIEANSSTKTNLFLGILESI